MSRDVASHPHVSTNDVSTNQENRAAGNSGPKSSGGMSGQTKTPANAHLGDADSGLKPKAMDARGAVGKQFTEHGAIGSVGQAIGGPLAADGAIGKQFTANGSIGGAVQNAMGNTKSGGPSN